MKKFLLLTLKISVSLSLLYFIMSKAGLHEVLSTLSSMSLLHFLTASLFYLFCIFISTVRWKLLISTEEANSIFSTARLYALYLMGAFFNNLMPGAVGGDAVRIYYLYKDSKSGASSFGSVFAERYMGVLGLISVALIALPFGLDKIRGSGYEWAVPVIALGVIVVSLLMFGLRLGNRFATVRGFYEYFLNLRKAPVTLLKVYIISIVNQLTVVTTVYIIAMGLGAEISLIECFLFVPIVITISTIPISISGLGLREGAFVILLGLSGIQPEMATSISFAWFLSYVLASTSGIPVYLSWKVKREAEISPIQS